MIRRIFQLLLIGLAMLVCIVLINTFRFNTELPIKPSLPVPAISDSAIRHMSEAVQIKTISYADSLPIDTTEYLRFRSFLERAYPLIQQNLPRKIFNQFSYLYTWEGKDKSLRPYVIMAHTDVVPVEEASLKKWRVPPFSGAVKDSMIWGRGVVDDKGCVVPILEAVEDLLQKHYQPQRTIYLSFGHDEEISGTHGARSIVDWFKAQQIHPELVIDEGGEFTVEQFPDLKRPVAAIGVGEKGYLSFTLRVEMPGGHSSMPQKETAIDVMSTALVHLRRKQMPFHITEPMKVLLGRVGAQGSFLRRMAISNQWLFQPLLEKEFEKDHVTNSLFHTTIVPTILTAGIKDNVIPTEVTAIVNCRNLPGDSQEDVIRFMTQQIGDNRVQIIPEKGNKEASAITDIKGPAFKKVESLCYEVMPDAATVPYLLMGGTDSYYFGEVSDGVIKFAASTDGKGYHGIDERLAVSDFKRMIFFYSLLIQQSGK